MPFADATYPPKHSVNTKRVAECLKRIDEFTRGAEHRVIDLLLGCNEPQDPKDVLHACREAFRCIGVWSKRAAEEVSQCVPTVE